ncbi:MAG TPA: hypothetical protein VFA58_04670, partial [Chthoniobacterales bacterium]|nr:hypothetical protein [Chthoniobacterales bacterium]
LDAAVVAAYGFSVKKDALLQLLALNLEVAAAKAPVQPGVPKFFSDRSALITTDRMPSPQLSPR